MIDAVEGEANRRISSVIAAQIPRRRLSFGGSFERRVLSYAKALKVIPYLSEKGEQTYERLADTDGWMTLKASSKRCGRLSLQPRLNIEEARREIMRGSIDQTPQKPLDEIANNSMSRRSREAAEVEGERNLLTGMSPEVCWTTPMLLRVTSAMKIR